jgi:serine phosphatase RsbU (regulator of sigma subunit)
VDPTTDPLAVTLASAGHPLPLRRRADGRVEPIGEPGQLLGPFADVTITDRTVHLAPDELLLLYTDGAVE